MSTTTPLPNALRLPDAQPQGEHAHVQVLDGVRGFAIVLVLLTHLNALPGRTWFDACFGAIAGLGWIGVDLFFVLSGFLITGILLDSVGAPHYYRNFYARRALRIFPLYYAILVFSLFVLPRFLPPDKALRFGSIAGDELSYWLYAQNLSMAAAGLPRHGVLDVTWSLAIEEQFYLIWPTVVLFCNRTSLRRLCGFLIAAPLGLRLLLKLTTDLNPFSIYLLTPCHIEGLAVGALIAVSAREPGGLSGLQRPAKRTAFVAGPLALSIALGELAFGTPTEFGVGFNPLFNTIGFTLLALFFGALLILVVTSDSTSWLHRAFASRLLCTFGKYSYGIYLVHLPIRAVIRDRLYGPSTKPARLHFPMLFGSELVGQLAFYVIVTPIVVGVAWLSYELFEKQFLRMKRFFPALRAPGARAHPVEGPQQTG